MRAFYYFLLVGYCAIWALKDVLAKLLLRSMSPEAITIGLSLVATAYAIVMLVASAACQRRDSTRQEMKPRHVYLLMGLSITTVGAILAVVYAVKIAGPVLYTLTDSTSYPMLVALLAWILLGERLGRSVFVAFAIGVTGVLVFQIQTIHGATLAWNWGIPIALLSSLLYALSIVLIKILLEKGARPETILLTRFLAADALLLIYFLLTGSVVVTTRDLWMVCLLGLFGYAIPFHMSFYALKHIPASTFGIFIITVPVFSSVFTALLIPNTHYGWSQLCGGALVVIGMVIVAHHFRRGGAAKPGVFSRGNDERPLST